MPGPGTPHNVAISNSPRASSAQGSPGSVGSPPLAAPQARLPLHQQQWSPLNPAATPNQVPPQQDLSQAALGQLAGLPPSLSSLLNLHYSPQTSTSPAATPGHPSAPPTPNPLQGQLPQVANSLLSAFQPLGVPLFPGQNVQPLLGGGHQAVLQQLKASSDLQRVVQTQIQYLVSSLLQSGLTIDQISLLVAQGQPSSIGAQPFGFPPVPQQQFQPPATPQPQFPNQGLEGQLSAPRETQSPALNSSSGVPAQESQPNTTHTRQSQPQGPIQGPVQGPLHRVMRGSVQSPVQSPVQGPVQSPMQQQNPSLFRSILPASPRPLGAGALPPSLIGQNIPSQDSPSQDSTLHDLPSQDLSAQKGLSPNDGESKLQFYQRQLETTTLQYQQRLQQRLQQRQDEEALNLKQRWMRPQSSQPQTQGQPSSSIPSSAPSSAPSAAPSSAPSEKRRVDPDRFRHVIPESLNSHLTRYVKPSDPSFFGTSFLPGGEIISEDTLKVRRLSPVTEAAKKPERPAGRPRTRNRVDNLNSKEDLNRQSRDMSITVSDNGDASHNSGASPQRKGAFFARFVEVNPALKSQWSQHHIGRPPKERSVTERNVSEPEPEPKIESNGESGSEAEPENKAPKRRGRKPGTQKQPRQRVGLGGDSMTRREARALERRQRDTRARGANLGAKKQAKKVAAEDTSEEDLKPTFESTLPPPVQPQGARMSLAQTEKPASRRNANASRRAAADKTPARRSRRDSHSKELLAARNSGAPPPVMPLNARANNESDENYDSDSSDTREQSEEELVHSEEDDWAPGAGSAAYKAKRQAEKRNLDAKRRKQGTSQYYSINSSDSSSEEKTPKRGNNGHRRA